ncbi:MBL fold metallo-hydrolase [Mangrovimicrobium sediminis]|nr:MBL fold metallo-hydrolase [Haliea sp. SAOS-164]
MNRGRQGKWDATVCALVLALTPLSPGVAGEQAGGADRSGPWKVAGGFSFDWPSVEIDVHPLSDTLYFMHGSGGNMLLSAGADGLLLVDNEFPEIHGKILNAIEGVQPGPVEFVLNTHFHGDHTGSNSLLAQDGALILAQDNSRQRMTRAQTNLFFGSTTPPAPAQALPVVTFPESMNLYFNGERIEFFYVSPAHTDGDAVAWFTGSNVVHMGDIYINGLYPIIDLAGGGSIDGYFPALDAVLARIDDATRVVPGHGPVGDKRALQAYRDMLWDIRNRVQAMIDAGRDIDAILAANPSRDYDELWASDRVGPDDVVLMIYYSLTGSYGQPE